MAAGAALERSPKRLDREIGALVEQRKTAAWGYPPPPIPVSLCRAFSWSGPPIGLQYLWTGSVLASPEGEISSL